MLELDVILLPYFEACFDDLPPETQGIFADLLACDDPDLFAWLMGHQICPNPELADMVSRIVAFNRSQLR